MTIGTIAEETNADTLPISGAHGEGISSSGEMDAISAVAELVEVLLTVVGDEEIEFCEVPALNDLALAVSFNKDALWAKTDASE